MIATRLVIATCLIGLLGLTSATPATTRAPEGTRSATIAPAGGSRATSHPVRFFNEERLRRARIEARDASTVPPGARLVVVPHHWLAGDLIVRGLSGVRGVDRVVLIGPDHANVGAAQVTTVNWRWETPFGLVEPDGSQIERLRGLGIVVTDSNVFAAEHAIDGLVPAIAAFFPGAEILPLALRSKMEARQAIALGAEIASLMDGRTLVIASVDFSHHLPDHLARARNEQTIEALRTLDRTRILGFGNNNLDSPGSMATLIEVAKRLGATSFDLLDSSTSADRGGHPSDVTSYILGFYA